jgi:hypothetical protein
MNPGKSVRFEGSKLLPTTAKSFLSNSNSSSGNNRNRNKNELNESLLPNEYEMSQGIINSNSNGYNSGSNSSNSSINRSNGIVGGSLSSASAVSPSLLSRDNPSIIGSTNVNINATDESNNILHNNRYDDDNYNDDSNINGDDVNNNNSNGVVNVDSNKIYLKNMKRAKRMIKEGYEWDVCLVLPNIEHEDYTDVPMREGYISMYSM